MRAYSGGGIDKSGEKVIEHLETLQRNKRQEMGAT